MKNTNKKGLVILDLSGWVTWIRTKTDRTKNCSATVTQ